MKKALIVIIISTIFFSCKSEKKDKTVVKEEVKVETIAAINNVDLASSVLTWKGTKPTGSHDGTIALKESSLILDSGKITGGEFIIDMSSIKNLDMAGSDGASKIEAHLKAPDFFDIASYPISTFVITEVKELDSKLLVTGNLTIKDVTKSITIPASLYESDGISVFTSELFNIDRADFNVKYRSKTWFDNLKDRFIDDLVEMSFTVKTIN
tara:strand:+ start:15893 stop:16525 length:633 start_codon:yes stop_codon:yes gene_type:complete